MIKIISTVAAALLLATAVPAEADRTTGIVSSVNSWTGSLMLQFVESFSFDDPVRLNRIAPGDRIGVSHHGSQRVNVYDPHPAIRDNVDIN
ncbi:hypothetical protein OSH08_03255 [Kaistia geumhonensis]|uniref:DUF5666 domain-containing protein n=1 Tax=Kaistia geumhonensis TaxID=410839 RepID=A0ABU0M7J6_9HYPH|nr:hypothetical protein [Kaistia geumhonensis]MCX5478006.1 hypothetical protein [Kaistia geumhonensis]MDQ0516780.1 hypothetical protein [Kaistia geumhonensis]